MSKMCVIVGLLLFTFISVTVAERCYTPNNEKAECVSLYTCKILIRALANEQNDAVEFVQRSNCGGTALNPMVCCGSASTFMTPQKTPLKNEAVSANKESLSDRRYCGYQHADDYFREDPGTSIDEFPWLANILNSGNVTICGGTLINNRYVLTAAHCVNITDIVGVRLGEFNVKNETDCVGADSDDLYECSEPTQEYGIEKKIMHPRYNQGPKYVNDIALLRLNQKVSYSDFIRPICLPTLETRLAKQGDTVTTTGWGLTTHGELSETKKKVLLQLISIQECASVYREFLTENHFCTRRVNSNPDTEIAREGDSGGPTMFSLRNQWYQQGVLSFGPHYYAIGVPEVHTKVVNYLEWIKENIEP